MEERKVITTQRGNQKYTRDGYLYIKDKASRDGAVQFWRCENKNIGCNARIWTNIQDGSFNCIRREHSCSTVGNAARVALQEVNATVRRLAETTHETPAEIRKIATQNVCDAVKDILPSCNTINRNIQRRRLKTLAAPINPKPSEKTD